MGTWRCRARILCAAEDSVKASRIGIALSREGFKIYYFREGKYEIVEASGPCGLLSGIEELKECLTLSGYVEGMCQGDRRGASIEVLERTGPSGLSILLERRGDLLRVKPFNRSLVDEARLLRLKRERAGAVLLSGRVFVLEGETLLEADRALREALRELCSE